MEPLSPQPSYSPHHCHAVPTDQSSHEPQPTSPSFYNSVMFVYLSQQRAMSTSVLAVVILLAALGLSAVSCLPNKKQIMDNMKIIAKQKQDLDKLECKPKATVVHLLDHLEHHDSLRDEDFFPKVVSVYRCDEVCSFCGNSMTGEVKGKCQPGLDGIYERTFLAFYFTDHNERKFQNVSVIEHKTCACSS